jgi:signal transduction histidine kinase
VNAWRRRAKLIWFAVAGPQARSGLVALIAMVLLLASVVVQISVNDHLRSDTEKASRRVEHDAILTVEHLAGIVQSLSDQRILVDDHILEKKGPAMREIEGRLGTRIEDLKREEAEYVKLIDLPAEAELWAKTRGVLHRFEADVQRVLVYSRVNDDEKAKAVSNAARADYDKLVANIQQLIELNRSDALAQTQRVRQLEHESDRIVWIIRGTWVLSFLLLAGWMVGRIAAAERTLEARNRDLDAFAGRVAHDLKNALGPVTMSTSLLRRAPGDPARVGEIADRIERSSRRAAEIIEALLAFSRGSGSVAEDEAASVKEAITSVLDEVADVASQSGVTLELGVTPDVAVRCEPRLLHIALANIVSNAIKYTTGSSVQRVRVSATTEGSACRIDVEDTGPGIAPNEREKIFLPFYRVPGSRASGTGIGLATVRRIVEARGGDIHVDSELGKGSVFHLRLPVVAVQVEHAPPLVQRPT